jgi:hypothetical protein
MFERIRKEIEKHYNAEAKKIAFFIKRGYYPDWAEEHRNDRDRGIKQHATDATLKAYQSGKITRAKAVEKATARALKENDKRKSANLEKLTEAESAPDIVGYISVNIEWKKSRTWGANPFAECWCGGYYTTGRASGCGYDKRTAATAAAFNSNPAIMKALYTAEEKRLAKRNKTTRRDFIGYGSGYGILPYFEGGVGISSHGRIFENIGFTFHQSAATRTCDAYTITRKTKKARA